MADAFLLCGFALVIAGIGLWSIPAACIVAGVALLYASRALRQDGK